MISMIDGDDKAHNGINYKAILVIIDHNKIIMYRAKYSTFARIIRFHSRVWVPW